MVATGPGDLSTDFKMEVKVGDRVMFGQYAGTEIETKEGKFLIMRENDIYGIFNPECDEPAGK